MVQGVTVTVEDLAPSRLTREQLAANPSLDVVHSKSLGYRYLPRPSTSDRQPAIPGPMRDSQSTALRGGWQLSAATCRKTPLGAEPATTRRAR
jgi:hypothetical protein